MKKILFLSVILCLTLGIPVWAADTEVDIANINISESSSQSGVASNENNIGLKVTANPVAVGIGGGGGQGGQGGQGGVGVASVKDVKTGDFSAEIAVEAPTITQTFEASDLWNQKGGAVLPGIASPNLMQQFVGGGIPLAERQDRVFQEMMALFSNGIYCY